MEKLKRIFASLVPDPEQLEIICSKFRYEAFGKADFLIRPGEIARKLFFIDQGAVILGSELEDKSVARHLINENEFITCLGSFSKQIVTQEFLKASENTRAYHISKKDFDAVISVFPAIEKFYNQLIFDTLLHCQQRITDLTSLDAASYYNEIMRTQPGHIHKMPQYDLASYMGIKPQSLSRLRKTKK